MRVILASASPRRRELLGQIGLVFEVKVSDVEEKVSATLPERVVEELSAQKAWAVLGAIKSSGKIVSGSGSSLLGPEGMSPGAGGEAGTDDLLVIGADTVVALEGRILGKPSTPEEAAAMLRQLAGRSHGVYTGVTLLYCPAITETTEGTVGAAASSEQGSVRFAEDIRTSVTGISTVGMGERSGIGSVQRRTFHERTKVSFYPMTEAEIADYVSSGDPMDKAGAYGIQGIFARYVREIEGDYNNVVGLPVGRLYQEAKEWLV